MSRINRDDLEKFHEFGIHVPTRTLSLDTSTNDDGEETGVNYVMVQRFVKNLHILEHASREPITIFLNTGGGDLWDGMAIYDAIKASSCEITVVVRGQASSMGSIILQAADHRHLYPHALVMFHFGTPSPTGNNVYELINAAVYERDFGERLDGILYHRICSKLAESGKSLSRAKYNDMNFKGRYLNAKEAVDLGLADFVVGAE